MLYGPRSAVWDEAENRLHAQKALLALLLGCTPGGRASLSQSGHVPGTVPQDTAEKDDGSST